MSGREVDGHRPWSSIVGRGSPCSRACAAEGRRQARSKALCPARARVGAVCDISRERLGLAEQGVVGQDPVRHPRGGHHSRVHMLGR
jgi:hypothetical protein